jgi:hypothetical protein
LRLSRAISIIIAAAAIITLIVVLVFLAFLCQSCGYGESGRTIIGPSQWYNYSVDNASYVVLDIYCLTLGENEINIIKSSEPGIVRIETVHRSMIGMMASHEQYADVAQVGISASYASDMYYGGARINVYLPDGPVYDIKVDTIRSNIYIGNFSGTNLAVKNQYSGDLAIDGGDYDYVYADNGGQITGQFRANNSTLKSGNGRVNVVTLQPA